MRVRGIFRGVYPSVTKSSAHYKMEISLTMFVLQLISTSWDMVGRPSPRYDFFSLSMLVVCGLIAGCVDGDESEGKILMRSMQ
jgi:hypothetical protein